MAKDNGDKPNFWESIGNWFSDLWDRIVNPDTGEKDPDSGGGGSGGGGGTNQSWDNYHDREKLKGDSIGYVGTYIKPKTFDEWLGDQKLSRDEKSENYFGNFYKKTAKSLVDQAYSNKESAMKNANTTASRAGTASHNAYNVASSNFSNGSERMFSNGLKNSGFSNYLKGISYLAYRDEINKTNNAKLDSIATADKNYTNSVTQIESHQAKQIADREKELLKLYNDAVGQNKDISASFAK
ncbi:MAG: hypothetical protein RR458_05020 [Clostridia bacterium]